MKYKKENKPKSQEQMRYFCFSYFTTEKKDKLFGTITLRKLKYYYYYTNFTCLIHI